MLSRLDARNEAHLLIGQLVFGIGCFADLANAELLIEGFLKRDGMEAAFFEPAVIAYTEARSQLLAIAMR
jgi:hypothetical protein